jgi:hypothetical protein
MKNTVDLTIRIADYAPVKSALEAAASICDAEGSSPWALSKAIEHLRTRLEALTSDSSGASDSPEVSGNAGEYQDSADYRDSEGDSEAWKNG